MIVLIMGGELNSEMEHQTARDTTTGEPRPMGRRNAVMADRLGRTYNELTDEPDDKAQMPKKNDPADRHKGAPAPDRAHGIAGALTGRNGAVAAAFLIGAFGVALAKQR